MIQAKNIYIALFKGKNIRRTIFGKEWWFSVVDVVEVLTDSVNPRDYWYKMKIRVKGEEGSDLSTICRQLKLQAAKLPAMPGKNLSLSRVARLFQKRTIFMFPKV